MEKRRRRAHKTSTAVDAFENAEDPPGFQKAFINEDIGWGVFATERFKKDDFLLIYKGTLLSSKEAEKQESVYDRKKLGSYMFYFKHGTETLCIDATTDDGSLGRLANDGWRGHDNCAMKKQIYGKDGHPYLALFAKKDIEMGEQLLYDYGVGEWPWRESKTKIPKFIDQIRISSAPTEYIKDIRTSTPIKGKDSVAIGRNEIDVNISQVSETSPLDLAFEHQDVEESDHLQKLDMHTCTNGPDPSATMRKHLKW